MISYASAARSERSSFSRIAPGQPGSGEAAEVRHDPPKIFSFWAGRCNLNRVDFDCGSQEGQSVFAVEGAGPQRHDRGVGRGLLGGQFPSNRGERVCD